MISVQEAKTLIKQNAAEGKIETKLLDEATGFVLAENVYSPIDTPPFNQSAMDGYAFAFDHWTRETLNIIGEVQAGMTFNNIVQPNQAVRIFTGAPLPQETDTVVIQEHVAVKDGLLIIEDENLKKGNNVRPRGSQSTLGELALSEKQWLTPAAISFLAGIGFEKVSVFAHPAISIIITGKELIKPGTPLPPGKIYESNAIGLVSVLKHMGITATSAEHVDDDANAIRHAIQNNLRSDILLITGGISVGDYDFVKNALKESGVEEIFHKVKQKPGKPLFFGKRGHTLVFGLPGNPASVFTCFYEYVVPAISYFCKRAFFKQKTMPLANSYSKKSGLTYFLKGKINATGVTILPHQESYLLNSFAVADCLVELDAEKEIFKVGELVKIQMIV